MKQAKYVFMVLSLGKTFAVQADYASIKGDSVTFLVVQDDGMHEIVSEFKNYDGFFIESNVEPVE